MKQYTRGNVSGEGISGEISVLLEKVENTYDGFNRLKKADHTKDGERSIVTFTYDGDGLRTQKTTKKASEQYAAHITNYYYDRQHVILETNESGQTKARYIRGINYIARYDENNEIANYLFNGHGDVVQTATESGEVKNQYDYDIFGNSTLTVQTHTNAIRYAGEFFDEETGLYYLRARYYNPYTGRFISEDSRWGEDTNPLSLNLYTYCSNDPINFIDPSGFGQVWNDYGEVIGTCDGPDYTDHSDEAKNTHGGGAQAQIPWNGGSSGSGSGSGSSSSSGSGANGSSNSSSYYGLTVVHHLVKPKR